MTSQPAEEKRFDCVEMMHEGAARVRDDLKCKSLEEQVTYWQETAKALLARQQELREEMAKARD